MLYIDGIGLSFLIEEIKDKIKNYKVTKIYQYDRNSFSLYFGKNNLLFQVRDNSTIFYLKNEKDQNTDFQSKFLLSLKKYLQNSILIDIKQQGFDRIIYFYFEKLNQFGDIEKYTLIMEIMGKSSNIFLTSKDRILSALYFTTIEEGNRVIMTGAKYSLPFEEEKITPLYLEKENFPFENENKFLNDIEGVGKIFASNCYKDYEKFKEYLENYKPLIYERKFCEKNQKVLTYNEFVDFEKEFINKEEFETLNEALNVYFKTTISSNLINEKKKKLLKYVDSQIKKYQKIKKNIEIDLNKNINFEKYKKIGDILAANRHLLKFGMENIELYDFYENKNINIKLDSTISPNENLNSYYNKYNKGKRTISALENRFLVIESEIKYFDEIKMFVENENDFIGIEEIEIELKIENRSKIKLNKHKKRELLSYEYDGFKIFVGRNNKENEEITFSKGNNFDIWLHAKDIPGSHVLIVKNNQEINDGIIEYASKLAAENSKATKGSKIEVDYCEKKYVKKIKNSKLGNVTYTNFSTILVEI